MTNPIGQNTVNVTVNMPRELRDELQGLARKSGMKLSAYMRSACESAARRGSVFTTVETAKEVDWNAAEDAERQRRISRLLLEEAARLDAQIGTLPPASGVARSDASCPAPCLPSGSFAEENFKGGHTADVNKPK